MKARAAILWAAFFGCLIAVPAQAQNYGGTLTGTFTGAASDGSATYAGGIDGTWTATVSSGAVQSVSGSGSFGDTGVAGTWQMNVFDPASRTISVTWSAAGNRGPSGSGRDGTVSLVLDIATATASGPFTGQFFTASGTKTINGTWRVRFLGAPASQFTGRIQGGWSGNAAVAGAVSGTVDGVWTVRFMPDGTVTGSGNGTYSGASVTVPGFGNICPCGTWVVAVVRGADGQYRMTGAWTHPQASGTLDGSGGGPAVFVIDTSTNPIRATGSFSGSTTFTVPIIGTLPIAVSGSWTATLAIDSSSHAALR